MYLRPAAPKSCKAILIIVFLLFQSYISGAQNFYYVRKGNQVHKVENADPAKVNPKEWQVLLFKRGAAQTPGTQWGIIDGKSAAQVMQKLKNSQDFEIRYNKWAGKGPVQDEVFTNFNALGPVAVMEDDAKGPSAANKNSSSWQEKAEKVKEIYDQVKEYYDGYQQIVEIIHGKTETPFDNTGDVFKDYADNLKQAVQRANSLQNNLQKNNGMAMEQIERAINEITNNLAVVKNKEAVIRNTLGISPDQKQADNSNAQQKTNKDQATKNSGDFDKLSEDLTNAMANIDPNNPDAAYKEIRRISRLLAKSIQDDAGSDENMKKLGALLLKIADTEDTDKLMEYMQQMATLMADVAK